MLAGWAITKGIELVVKGFDNWIHRVEKANEAMQDAVGEYESAKSSRTYLNTMCKYFLVLGDKSVHFSDTIYT